MTAIKNMIFGAGYEICGDYIKPGVVDGATVCHGMLLVELKDGAQEKESEVGRLMMAIGDVSGDGVVCVVVLVDQSEDEPRQCPYISATHVANVYAFIGTVTFWQNAVNADELPDQVKGEAA